MGEPSRREDVQIGRALRLDRRGALDLLRDLARDRAVLSDLRRLWAREAAAGAACFAPDEQVLGQLADRVAAGGLVIARVRPPVPRAPPPGSGAVDGAAAPADAASSEQAPEDQAVISNPRWSVDRVAVGAELGAAFSYVGCEPGQAVTIKVYEVDASGAKKQVDAVETQVPAKSGDHEAKWKRDPDKAAADLKEDEAAGERGPLEYRFTVEAEGSAPTGLSGPLWLTNTVKVDLKDVEGKAPSGPRIVVLNDFEREQRARAEDGEAEFEGVLVGPIRVRLAEPRFTDLAWSEPKVPVGQPVDAVFAYEDAIEGMKATVVIREIDADGTSSEAATAEVELDAASGEAKASFTRTEDEAQADIAEDERDGDTGPLEYRYSVVPEIGRASELSEPLWLTHTVALKLQDAAAGQPFPDGLELVLVAADGEEHRAALAGGEARFEGVVCGPMIVKLAPKKDEGGSAP